MTPHPPPPANLRPNQVKKVPLDTLEHWCSRSFEIRSTTAVAMACGAANQAIYQRFTLPRNLEATYDALLWAENETLLARERFMIRDDPRLPKMRSRHQALARMRKQVMVLIRDIQASKFRAATAEEGDNTLTRYAQRLLVKLHPDRMAQLHESVCFSRSIPPNSPWRNDDPARVDEAIENAIYTGMVRIAPTNPAAPLREMEEEELIRHIQDDTRNQDKRDPRLRDLAMLARWSRGLDTLLDRISPHAHAHHRPIDGNLLSLDYESMTLEEAEAYVRARRAFLAVWQRRVECRFKLEEARLTLVRLEQKFSEPWLEANAEARELLVRENPEQFQALLELARPHTDPEDPELMGELMAGSSYRTVVNNQILAKVRERFRVG